jgi:hypothetical protein
MSPISQLARNLPIIHAVMNCALDVYSFIKPSDFSEMTEIETLRQALQDTDS